MVSSLRLSLESNRKYKGSSFSCRHIHCLLLFLGYGLNFATRVNMSIAIVAMTDKEAANTNFSDYDWSQQTKSYIFSSFFCGYILLQISAGGLSRRYGARLFMLLSVGISSLLALLTPLSVSIGDWPLLCVLRFVQGLAQGILLPAIATIMSKWAPIEERSLMQTLTYSGADCGIFVMLATSGKLCYSHWGWPSTFYLPGALGLLWSVIWFVYGASTPRDCTYISAYERAMIEESLNQNKKIENKEMDEKAQVSVPWRSIFTSKHFLVLLLNHCANDWCVWTLLTQIPTYIKYVWDKDINSNAMLSALPYLCLLSLSLLLCPLASWLEKSEVINRTLSRKIFNTIGFWIPAVSITFLGYLRRDQGDLAVGLLTATIALTGTLYFGYAVNHLDLAPNLAGTLEGIANCASSMMGILAPLVVGCIITDTQNINQWRLVFFLSALIAFIANLLFLFVGTAEVQWWNEPWRNRVELGQMVQLVAAPKETIISTVGTKGNSLQATKRDNDNAQPYLFLCDNKN